MIFKKLIPGLMGKMILAILIVGLLPLVLVSTQLILLNRRAFNDQVLRLHALATKTAASRIESYIQARRGLVQTLGANPSLYLDPTSSQAQTLLSDLLVGAGEFQVIAAAAVNRNGEEYFRAQRKTHAGLAQRLMAESWPDDQPLVVDGDGCWLTLATPFPDGQGGLRVIFQANPLLEMIGPMELGEEAVLSILGPEDSVVIQSQVTAEQPPKPLRDQAQSHLTSGASKFEGEGFSVLGAWAPVSGTSWHIVSWQPLRVAEAISRTMQRHAVLIMTFALALVFGLSVTAYIQFFRPIKTMVHHHRNLVDSEGGNEGNEIQQLQSAFAALERHVKHSETLEQVFLGRYKVIEKVGSGAMGNVFHAWDPKLKRPVALKTIRLDRPERNHNGDDLELSQLKEGENLDVKQLVQEAVTAARFSHDNVVSIYDVQDNGDLAFIAMEYVDGLSLNDYLRNHKLTHPEIIALALHIARGLSAAHNQGIAHRDIKPANILLGKDGQVKIADFGISQFVSSFSEPKETVFGTPGYIPPETLEGNGYDRKGDLFALGVVMYQAVTGQHPFPGKSFQEIMMKTLFKEPSPINDQSVPQGLQTLINRLLEKNPTTRLSGTDELLKALTQLASEYPLKTPFPEIEVNDKEEIVDEIVELCETLMLGSDKSVSLEPSPPRG